MSLPSEAFACRVFARPTADGQACLAWLYGLRGADSLRPWHAGETNDVRELARRDYEPEHGAGWEAEWQRRQEESFTILEGRLGDRWAETLESVQRSAPIRRCHG